MMEHLIKTLKLDVQLGKTQRSHAKGEEVTNLVQSRLLPELEAAFDKMSNAKGGRGVAAF
ncbi:MAG: hypothetical protein IPM82_25945 [Saprospiraceae bacterium]|nr:hypothetical protein [Saprospiraceae bacterium]